MNSSDQWKQIERIFHAALERLPPERESFLQQACADDPFVRSEVDALLVAHEADTEFLGAPAIKQAPPLFDEAVTQIQMPATTRHISHYEILRLLGKGGMGEVYLATDTSLGRKAALKILPARYTTEPDLVHRFEREAKAASALNHPNILTVYEIGKTEDSHFIATEFIEGETLRQRLARGNLALKEALDIAIQIAAALTAAHEAGIIHRDIKPENIMIRPDGYVKVLDFGLAKLTESVYNPDESTTQTGMIMGTPSYMSPEQARGQKVDARADLWSLGVVLFELVSGARPFGGATQADLLVSILEHAPLPLPDSLPPELTHTISQTLAKDPGHRCATARELGQAMKTLQHKLALTSGLPHFTASSTEASTTQSAEAPTLPRISAFTTVRQQVAVPAVATPVQKPARVSPRLVLASLLVVVVIGSYFLFRPATPTLPIANPSAVQPQRELTWWLTAQRMSNGKLEGQPFQSAGGDWFPNGSQFKFNLTSAQAGYLYLLNEGITEGDALSLNLLYPTPKNNSLNAAVAANQAIQSDNYHFDSHPGEEKFWMVWAAQPVAEIEAAKATATPEIKSAQERNAILAFLNQHVQNSRAKADEDKEQTHVSSASEIAVSFVKLRHR